MDDEHGLVPVAVWKTEGHRFGQEFDSSIIRQLVAVITEGVDITEVAPSTVFVKI